MPVRTLLLACALVPAPCALPLCAAGDQALGAMEDEMNRSITRLKMDDLAAPYYVSYYLVDSTTTALSASFGAVINEDTYATRRLAADVRIGSRAFDNTNYAGSDFYEYKPFSDSIPTEENYDALRFSIWSLTDQAYKSALETYSRKKAYMEKKNLREVYGDLSEEKPETLIAERPAAAAFDARKWKETVRRLSAVFKKFPRIQNSDVELTRSARVVRFVNSEGSRYRIYRDNFNLDISAAVQTREGLKVNDSIQFNYASPASAPGYEALAARTEEFAKRMSYLVESSTAEVYLGPVLFEGQAAAEFFNQLFVENISFTRAPWADDEERRKYYVESGALADKFNMRVMAPFLSVYDDPARTEAAGSELIGSYEIDDEGVRPGKLELVKNGKLVNFYMSRAPVRQFKASNGHGRRRYDEFASARPGNVFIVSERTASNEELKKKLLATAKEIGLDYAIIVRRMAGGGSKRTEDLLAKPVLVYEVSVKDGSEELLSGMEFEDAGFRALRDIMLTSDDLYVHNFYQPGPLLYRRSSVPAAIVAPSILVREMELQRSRQKPDRQPYLPHPYFGHQGDAK
jgi:predicted Zn-dependent protease